MDRISKEKRPTILAQAKEPAEQVEAVKTAANAADAEVDHLAHLLPDLVLDGVPVGNKGDFMILHHKNPTPRGFAAEGLEPQGHLALSESLDAIDIERGTKASDVRFYYLKGIDARLELTLVTMAMDRTLANGFAPMVTPTPVIPQAMDDTGFLDEHSDGICYLPANGLYLTGMPEVAPASYHIDEILDLSDGLKRYMGWFTCYRCEASSAGGGTRGIVRVHQFSKAEMFSYCHPEEAAEEHQHFLTWEEEMLAKVELPYHVIDTAADDLDTSAVRKFSCKAWPSTRERYMEVTLTPNCTTFQARRLSIRRHREDGMASVAALSDTLVATRWIAAFLENHQQADSSIYMPGTLRPYLGGLEVLSPIAR